jgi:hypothetical protein
MNNTFTESGLVFDFSECNSFEKFDTPEKSAYGTSSVDFVVEKDDAILFIEVKNYNNPKATKDRNNADDKIIEDALTETDVSFFRSMGAKIKDSLLKYFAFGRTFCKPVVFLLVINKQNLLNIQIQQLIKKLDGYIPTGLNKPEFPAFTKIFYDILSVKDLPRYGINCIETI